MKKPVLIFLVYSDSLDCGLNSAFQYFVESFNFSNIPELNIHLGLIEYRSTIYYISCEDVIDKDIHRGIKLKVYFDEFFQKNERNKEMYEVLESLESVLRNNKKQGVCITKVWDEPSLDLCYQSYCPLARYERLLKCFINEILLKSYGTNWYYEKIKNSSTLDRKTKDYIVERARVLCVDEEEIAVEMLSLESISYFVGWKKQEDFWSNLSKNLPYMNEFEKKANVIKGLRNKVMHSNTLSYKDYESIITISRECEDKLLKAINDIKNITFDPKIFDTLFIVLNLLPNIMESMLLATKTLAKLGEAIKSLPETIIENKDDDIDKGTISDQEDEEDDDDEG